MSVSSISRALPDNLSDLVGCTPLVRLGRLAPGCDAELVGKLEAYNPAGSVKDRIGVAMIEAAEAEGRIEPGRTTIVEATSSSRDARPWRSPGSRALSRSATQKSPPHRFGGRPGAWSHGGGTPRYVLKVTSVLIS